jgi:arginyl-tRNA synthetase
MIPDVVKELEDKGLIKLDKGAKCIFVPGKQQPLIAVKSDGGYNYDSTDLAAIRYRIKDLKGERLIYITDAGQYPHFELIFKAAEMAGWLQKPIVAEHMGFGFVLRADGGKFKTSEGNTVKLMTLLDEAKDRAKKQILQRIEEHKEGAITNIEEKEVEESAEKIGMAAIKYFDLRQNRISNYKFNYDQMLDPTGNTAVYLLYAYARLCSIIRKSGMTEQEIDKAINETGFKISHEYEAVLATCILRFPETIEMAVEELALHKITDFLYDIAVKVAAGYNKFKIVGDENQTTRILLCEAIRRIMAQSFYLIGIEPLEKI